MTFQDILAKYPAVSLLGEIKKVFGDMILN